MQVAEQTREEAEEWLLLEVGSEFLVRIGQDENNNREHFGHVVHFGFVIVGSGRIGMVFDHKHDQLGEGIDRLENTGSWSPSGGFVLDVAVNADFGAHAEEEGRNLLPLEDPLVLELDNEVDKRLLD